LEIIQPNQKNTRFIFEDVHYVPDLMWNLFIVTCAMSNGAEISSSGLQLIIKKGLLKIIFYQVIKSANSCLLVIKALPIPKNKMYKISDTVMPTMTETIKASKSLYEKR
jgi:hypothetical protein